MTQERARFYDPRHFEFAGVLEQNWRAIYREFLLVQTSLMDWYEKEIYGEGWKVFALYGFPHGDSIEQNVERCPVTASLVRTHIPTHGAAGFSVLRPATRIQPHRGYPGDFLRCHLGLKIPPGDCGLRIENESRRWEPGKVLIFDDRLTHEAWNLTSEDRAVLLIDFVPATGGARA